LKLNYLPGLWQNEQFTFGDLQQYFSGDQVVYIQHEGYEEPLFIPYAERSILEDAVRDAVENGVLWLTSGPASIYSESIPAGVLSPNAVLHSPPDPVRVV